LLFNGKELVHVPEAKLVVSVIELVVVAHALQQDELLSGALLCDSSLNELDDK
jgi:hypothetical protein